MKVLKECKQEIDGNVNVVMLRQQCGDAVRRGAPPLPALGKATEIGLNDGTGGGCGEGVRVYVCVCVCVCMCMCA
jgi:hypothetical protein